MGDVLRLPASFMSFDADSMRAMADRNERRRADEAGFGDDIEGYRAAEDAKLRDAVLGRRRSAILNTGLALDREDAHRIAAGTADETTATRAVREWIAQVETPGARRALVLCGPVGTGKTFAAGVAIDMLESRSVEVVRSPELALRYAPFAADIARGVQPLDLRARLVVLDDLGAERSDPRHDDALLTLIEDRTKAGLLIVTGNLLSTQIRERYGNRVASRLNKIAKVVLCVSEDLRGTGAGL